MTMKRIGITGNIGSGKSWVCALFESLGIPVFHSDDEAKRLYDLPEVKEAITGRFGKDAYLPDGCLNRMLISKAIFSNEGDRDFVEQTLYPTLNRCFAEWTEAQKAPFVMYESAIIYEKHIETMFDAVIMVSASEETRLRRVMTRDHCDEKSVRARMANQWGEEVKCYLADYVIVHDDDDEDAALLEQIDAICRKIAPESFPC